jgi:ABC-type phosphate transport system permease subunit
LFLKNSFYSFVLPIKFKRVSVEAFISGFFLKNSIKTSRIFKPGRTLTATIAAELGESPKGGEHYQALFAIGLLLFILSFVVNLLADYFISSKTK